jgi:GxxExxY protein
MKNEEGGPNSFVVIGAAMEVHRLPGARFLESVDQRSFAVEFASRGIPAERDVSPPVHYKGHDVGVFKADFICFSTIIVELKAQAQLTGGDLAQVVHYLRAACLSTGLLLNFGTSRLDYRRLANTVSSSSSLLSASSA